MTKLILFLFLFGMSDKNWNNNPSIESLKSFAHFLSNLSMFICKCQSDVEESLVM